MKKFISLLLLFLVLSASAKSVSPADITRDEAIKLAEAAVVRNGCTDLMPLKDREKLSFDRPDAEFVINHDLDCNAVFARQGEVKGKAVWIVGFKVRRTFPEMSLDRVHRLVLIDMDGKHLRLESRVKRVSQLLSDR